ncbi:precorrin-3B C(17)-methyltransferase [Celerinatantimonas sp. YJH-8]|uniref:precorrin-3B C(17)-methyltransferase n=1 Tax=Celerinatantimonas sp. YJH-8 TaxID=3228714 RepID=UPI0038CB0B2E
MATLFLVGLGPGAKAQMTYQAAEAIERAEVIVGYGRYLSFIESYLVGKTIIESGMTREWQRARQAIEAAVSQDVALVCSGDSGVYAMAPLVFELLSQNPSIQIEVTVVPGVTAAVSCASLVGAPLGHDHCSISLSDLLTPWPVICQRIEAVASSDFVVAFYNPRSRKRQHQIEQARDILLKYRSPDTPVAIVDQAYRAGQQVMLATLADFCERPFAMAATVIVGNSNSYRFGDYIITPRGYQQKYSLSDGALRPGQRRGRTLVVDDDSID